MDLFREKFLKARQDCVEHQTAQPRLPPHLALPLWDFVLDPHTCKAFSLIIAGQTCVPVSELLKAWIPHWFPDLEKNHPAHNFNNNFSVCWYQDEHVCTMHPYPSFMSANSLASTSIHWPLRQLRLLHAIRRLLLSGMLRPARKPNWQQLKWQRGPCFPVSFPVNKDWRSIAMV